MNAGTFRYATQNPCQAPTASPITRVAETEAITPHSSLIMHSAQTAPAKPRTDPTERSMWPATITSTMPMARIAVVTVCTKRFDRFRGVRKTRSVTKEKITQIPSSARNIVYCLLLRFIEPRIRSMSPPSAAPAFTTAVSIAALQKLAAIPHLRCGSGYAPPVA